MITLYYGRLIVLLKNSSLELNFIINKIRQGAMIKTSISSPPPSLSKGKSNREKIVYKLTKNAIMKFRPQRNIDSPTSSGLIDRIRSLSKYFSREKQPRETSLGKSNEVKAVNKQASLQKIKFLFRLDIESYLIGNNGQLDALGISVVEDYIETEQLWAFRLKTPILNLLVDDRRRIIVAVVTGEIQIYGYEGKKSKVQPKLNASFRAVGEVKYMQLAKDSFLTVFFQNEVHSYIIDGANPRQTSKKNYNIDPSLKFFQPALCIESIINVFFYGPSPNGQKVFLLWCLPIEIIDDKLFLKEVKKIYEIQEEFKDSLKIQSISKDSYFMNLGQSILMFSKGYCVDKVFINMQLQQSILKYFGDRKLIHISPSQIDLYNVAIDLLANPPKLTINSFDSIASPQINKYQFIDAIKFQQHKIAFFYQHPFFNSSGEVKYQFVLTQVWNLQQKIDSILPKISDYKGKYEGEEFKSLLSQIEFSCDAVGKMGMSRKQAYLRIWRQSKKEQVEEFKLLLDTLDYNTIRQEILLKLKKKSMLFLEVHKIESGCLGMIGQNLFGVKSFTVQEFKNYMISHFLMRKLELLKEIKLYERRSGKVKVTDSEGDKAKEKLWINIQQYTNVVKMDIKSYLLQLIYSYIKHGKDVKTQIRIVVRKFKFAFRFIYQSLLRQIVNLVKQDLLTLLKNIPEFLPYIHLPELDPQSASLSQGIWGEVKQQEWQASLIIQNVTTVYNKQLILQFSNNIWLKRYWLTYHDMIFLTRAELKELNAKIGKQYLFYHLIDHIYTNYKNQGNIEKMVKFIEETYILFPPHLFNNVQLYRDLYMYFKTSSEGIENFQDFLQKTDQEIFKKIFDHEKVKKGSFLGKIKPIYQNLKQGDKFNIGLLKYFSSNLSEVSDIKYLLNRINNQKREFHAQNEQMYQVLVKGMQIKLKLGSDKDIPFSEVLIYIENIPLASTNPVVNQLKILKNINEESEKFKKMKLNMSVFEMIRNRDGVLLNSVTYYIENSGIRSNFDEGFVVSKSKEILQELSNTRRNIYGPFDDNIIIFIFMIKLLESIELIPFAKKIIEQNTNETIIFDQGHLENVVFYCYRKKIYEDNLYENCRNYLQTLVLLLDEDNHLRIFILLELELSTIFQYQGKRIKFPICGSSGLISKRELKGMMELLSKQKLMEVNVERVFEVCNTIQKIVSGQVYLTLNEIYQMKFMCLLQKRGARQAIEIVEGMYGCATQSQFAIVYPVMIFKEIMCEFTEENKQLMFQLLTKLFRKPVELLEIFRMLFSKSFSNDEQKVYLSEMSQKYEVSPSQKFKNNNYLYNNDFLTFLAENTEEHIKVLQLLRMHLVHLVQTYESFAKSTDIYVFQLFLVQEPSLVVKYLDLNRNSMNLKEFRSFISQLCKFEVYDAVKVLQFAKRVYKVIYDLQNSAGDIAVLLGNITSTPLEQTRSIDQLPAETENLSKVCKSIDKIKAKLKSKMNSSSLRKRGSANNIQQLIPPSQKILQYLNDPHKYFQKTDYPFNDSDCEPERKQLLTRDRFIQGQDNLIFSPKKYLTWLFSRTNQQIQYYLLKSNEAEVDEMLRLQQQALKLSFRKTPKDKAIKQHAQLIVRSYNKVLPQETEVKPAEEMSMLPISAIAHAPHSALTSSDYFVEEIQEINLGASMLKDQIISTMRVEQDKVNIDAEIFKRYGSTQQLQSSLPELIKEVYADSNIEFSVSMLLIRQIYNMYPKIAAINPSFLEIYSKVDQIQKKLNLSLQIRSILPFEGLVLKQKQTDALFNFVKPYVLPHLNENNIQTLSKILSLSFKKQEYQQQITNQFFSIIAKEFNQIDSEFDETMKLQKIIAIAQKMPLSNLKTEIERIITIVRKPQKRVKLINAIVNVLRQRNDLKNAEILNSKLLNEQIKLV